METTQRYREIGAFLGVAQSLNFTEAAKHLGVSQPTLSRLVARLEDRIGTQLLDRNTRRMSLTQAGKVLLGELEGIDGRIARALDSACRTASGHCGEIRIAYNSLPINTRLPQLLRIFQDRNPDIQLVLKLQTSALQLSELGEGMIDLAFSSIPARHKRFHDMHLSEHRILAVLNANDPLARKRELAAGDLADRALILGNPEGWISFNPILDAFLWRAGLLRNQIYRAEDFESICAMVSVGFGIGFFIETTASMRRQTLVTRPISGLEATVSILLTWRKNLFNPAARRLIKLIRHEYSKQ